MDGPARALPPGERRHRQPRRVHGARLEPEEPEVAAAQQPAAHARLPGRAEHAVLRLAALAVALAAEPPVRAPPVVAAEREGRVAGGQRGQQGALLVAGGQQGRLRALERAGRAGGAARGLGGGGLGLGERVAALRPRRPRARGPAAGLALGLHVALQGALRVRDGRGERERAAEAGREQRDEGERHLGEQRVAPAAEQRLAVAPGGAELPRGRAEHVEAGGALGQARQVPRDERPEGVQEVPELQQRHRLLRWEAAQGVLRRGGGADGGAERGVRGRGGAGGAGAAAGAKGWGRGAGPEGGDRRLRRSWRRSQDSSASTEICTSAFA